MHLTRLVCLSALTLSALSAQDSRGAIAGRVTDAHDGGIPGARIVIANADTGVATHLTTNEKGAYAAPLLLPGVYNVTAEHDGFKRAARTHVELSVNDDLQVDLRLEVGSTSESITVTESAPVLEATNASMGILLGRKDLTELPIAHGNPYQLLALAPGTTFEGDMLLNRPYEPTHIVAYSMGGSV